VVREHSELCTLKIDPQLAQGMEDGKRLTFDGAPTVESLGDVVDGSLYPCVIGLGEYRSNCHVDGVRVEAVGSVGVGVRNDAI
jgi:hypothetical protein